MILSRLISGLSFLAGVITAYFHFGKSEDALGFAFGMGGALVFIWYGGVIGEFSHLGGNWGLRPIYKESPGGVIMFLGWIGLLSLLLLIVWRAFD